MPRHREEERVSREIRRALSRVPGCLVLRNQTNVFTRLLEMVPSERRNDAYRLIPESERHGLGIGSPDELVLLHSMATFLEVKAEDGRLSEGQITWHAAARAKGVRVEVVRSVEEALRAVGV